MDADHRIELQLTLDASDLSWIIAVLTAELATSAVSLKRALIAKGVLSEDDLEMDAALRDEVEAYYLKIAARFEQEGE